MEAFQELDARVAKRGGSALHHAELSEETFDLFDSRLSFGSLARGWGSTAPAPSGLTRSGSVVRQPSEIPSWTRSVSAFLLSRASTRLRSSGAVRSEPQPRARNPLILDYRA